MAFQTTHKLDFYVAPHFYEEFINYKVGTCHGIYSASPGLFEIVVIMNDEPGNGHVKDVFDWFYHSCKRDKRRLRVVECWNKPFKQQLIEKHGFVDIGDDTVELSLKQIKNKCA